MTVLEFYNIYFKNRVGFTGTTGYNNSPTIFIFTDLILNSTPEITITVKWIEKGTEKKEYIRDIKYTLKDVIKYTKNKTWTLTNVSILDAYKVNNNLK